MENIMQKTEMKEAIKIANMSKAIPTSKNMVKVSSLLTKEDEKRIEEYSMGSVGVQVGKEKFFLSVQHNVPAEASLLRDNQGQLLGVPAVVGG